MDARLESALRYADDIDLYEHLSRRIHPSITVAAGTHRFSSKNISVSLINKKNIIVNRSFGIGPRIVKDIEEAKVLVKLLSAAIVCAEKTQL